MRRTLRIVEEIDKEYPSIDDTSAMRHHQSLRRQVGLEANSPLDSSRDSDSSHNDSNAFDECVLEYTKDSKFESKSKLRLSPKSVASKKVARLMTATIENHENRMQQRELKRHKYHHQRVASHNIVNTSVFNVK